MIEITHRAADFMKQALDSVEEKQADCFRLKMGEQGPHLALDDPNDDDKTFDYNGEVILIMDPETIEQFQGRKIDFDEQQSQLVVTGAE